MGTKAAKDSKLLANAQLVIEQKHVQMLERKVKTQSDELLLFKYIVVILVDGQYQIGEVLKAV